jgi:polysaccharide biosynthesis protein PslG
MLRISGWMGAVIGLLLAADASAQPAPQKVELREQRWPRLGGSYFGLNGTKFFHVPEQVDGAVAQRIAWLKELGVTWDRSDLWWHIVEPEPGKFDLSRADLVLNALAEHGIQWYPILCYGAAWYHQEHTAPLEDAHFAAFAHYVERAVDRYRGRVPFWEVWNEPNIAEFWSPEPDPQAYARLLKASYRAIKRVDPQALVCAPAIAPLGQWDRKFVEAMYRAGTASFFDVFDYHYYRNHAPENEVPNEIAEIRAVMRRYGGEKPLQISEFGVSTLAMKGPDPELQQAQLVVRNHLLVLALGIQRAYYFDLQNWTDDTPDDWASQLGLVTAAGQPKKAFTAYKTLVDQLDFTDVVGLYRGFGDDIYAVLYRDRESDVYSLAIWSPQEQPQPVEVLCAEPFATVTEMLGSDAKRSAAQTPDGMRLGLRASRSPIYVEGVDPATYLPAVGVDWAAPLTILSPGQSTSLSLNYHAALDPISVHSSKVEVPDGVNFDPGTNTIRVAAGVAPGRYPVTATLTVGFELDGEPQTAEVTCTTQVEVIPAATVRLVPQVTDHKLAFEVHATNHADARVSAPVRLVNDATEASVANAGPLSLSAGETGRTAIDLPRRALPTPPAAVRWRAEFDGVPSRALPIIVSSMAEDSFNIDGDLLEWANHPAAELNRKQQVFHQGTPWSPADASAAARVAVTPDTLYVAVAVTDDDPLHHPFDAGEMWRGDSVELFVGFCGPASRTVINKACDVQIGLQPKSDGSGTVFRFHFDEVIETARIASQKTPEGYTIEAAIPLSALNLAAAAVEPGDVLALDFQLNDLDEDDFAPAGVSRGNRLAWSGSGSSWIDPSEYGLLIIAAE